MRERSRLDGQALVELALGLPLVLLLIFGVLELGRAFFVKIAMTNAAREGANYLIYHPDDVGTNFAYSKTMVINELTNSGLEDIDPSQIQIQCLIVTFDIDGNVLSETVDATCAGRSTAEVIISTQHELSIFGFFTGPIPMQSSARMVIP
jgi:Flp pilus assembly protein TadG